MKSKYTSKIFFYKRATNKASKRLKRHLTDKIYWIQVHMAVALI